MKVRDVIGTGARVTTRAKSDFTPDVTIVTPTYRRNAEGLLRRCLESARAQTHASYEHIVIDDGSSDGTEEVLRALCEEDERIVYVRHDVNSGLPAVRTNEGILRARGRAIAFLFDDNVFRPDFLEEAWSLLGTSGADLVHGLVEVPRADGERKVFGGWPASLDLMRNLNTIPNGGVLVRREFFDRYGLYDPHVAVRRLCDWELWLRALWLGARFVHLPRVVAEEWGQVSATSLGNTVTLDWKVSLAHLQDTSAYAERARRLLPGAIFDARVLDPRQVHPYLRDVGEWTRFSEAVYAPFLKGRDTGFDPMLLSNRAESVEPGAGWNPPWALHGRRFRVMLLANTLPAFASLLLEAFRSVPGAIVISASEWSLSLFEAGDFDVIVSLDGAAPQNAAILEAHRAAGAQVLYVAAFGEQAGRDVSPLVAPSFAALPVIMDVLGPTAYFPQAGVGRPSHLDGFAEQQRAVADVVLDASARPGSSRPALPALPLPALSSAGREPERRIAYRLHGAVADATETVRRPSAEPDDRAAGDSLGAMILSRDGAEIRVEPADLHDLPAAEAVAVAALAAVHDVDIVAPDGTPFTERSGADRLAAARDWQGWLANLLRVVRLRHRLGVRHRRPLTVDIYLNSELFAGSEVFGLHIARCLLELGLNPRIRIPERNIYGEPAAIDAWLAEHGLPPAVRAPYLPSVHHTLMRPPGERAAAVARLEAFVRADPPDLIIASGHIPQLVELRDYPPLFMAFFSAAAYQQSWLRELRGGVDGIMSDSLWALRPTAAVIGAPGRVIPSAVFGAGGSETARVTADPRRWPVRVAVAGTIVPRKRQLEAVRAVAALRRRGYDVELHLYGFELEAMRDYAVRVDETIAAEGMAGHVVRHGFVEDGSQITRDNDIILCASTDESLPQGLVFQMYEGLVGVSVLCGGIDEMIVDGETGYLTHDPNPGGIAEALRRALDDRANWRTVTEAARRHIHAQCGAVGVTTKLLDLIEEGLALRVPRPAVEDAPSAADAVAAPLADGEPSDAPMMAAEAAAELRARLGFGEDGRERRIAYFCHSPYLGGAENVILKLARMAGEHALRPILALPASWGGTRGAIHLYAEQAGIPVHQLPLWVETEVVPDRPLDAAAVAAIAGWLRDNDVALVHSVTLMREVGAATRSLGIPHVASLFATESTEPARIDHCDAVHSDTWLYAERWGGVLGTPAERILSSVPHAFFAAGTERGAAARIEAIGRRAPTIALLGTLQPRKGQLKAVEAVARLSAEHGLRARLVLCGYSNLIPDYTAECRALAAAKGIEDLVEIRGFVEEGPHLALRDADILLCASDWESLPQSILEGMAAGALIVAPRVGGIGELLGDDSAILIPDNSPDAIVAGLLEALSADPGVLRGRIEAGRAIAWSACTSDTVLAAMLQLYARAADRLAEKRRGTEEGFPHDVAPAAAVVPVAASAPDEREPLPMPVPPAGGARHRVRLRVAPGKGAVVGVELAAVAGARLSGGLASRARRDIELRRADAVADSAGTAELRWRPVAATLGHEFVLDLEVEQPGRRALLSWLRPDRIALRRVIYDDGDRSGGR